jgi:NAD(P)-dependent dehydrogenase (short-subunit alcohol dehydrogenase family)
VSARSPGDHDGAAHFIAANISTPDGPPHLAACALEYLGGIDILVDNAAGQTIVPYGVLAMSDADWLADLNSSLL